MFYQIEVMNYAFTGHQDQEVIQYFAPIVPHSSKFA